MRVVLIEDKMKENRFRWFSHIVGKPLSALAKRCETIHVGRKKKKKEVDL